MRQSDFFDITDDTEIKPISDKSLKVLNTTPFNDPRLSLRAKGIHAYIQANIETKPVLIKDVIESSADGRKSVMAGISELRTTGYIKYSQVRDSNGRYGRGKYKFFYEPIEVSRKKLKALELLQSDELDLSKHSEIIDVLDPDLSHSLNEMIMRQVAHEQDTPTQENDQNVSHKRPKNSTKSGKNEQLSDPLPEKTEECHKIHSTPEKQPESLLGVTVNVPEKVYKLTKNAENATECILKPIRTVIPLRNARTHYRSLYSDLPFLARASALPKNKRSLRPREARPQKNFSENEFDRADYFLKSKIEKQFISLLKIWDTQPNLIKHKITTKSKIARRTIYSLLKVLPHYSMEVVVEAIHNYNWIIAQPFTRLRSANRPTVVGIDEFFKFSEYSNKLRNKQKHPLQNIESWFEECRKGKDYLLKTYTQIKKDYNSEVTDMLCEEIYKSHLFDIKSNKDFLPADKNGIIAVSNKLVEFIKSNRDRLPVKDVYSKCISTMFSCLADTNQKKITHPGFLLNDVFWNRYKHVLMDMGMLRK